MLRREDELSQLLWNGVAGGSGVAILQNLKDCGLVDKYGPALVEAVAKNDMTSIKWVLANFPQSERISPYCVLVEAASRGNLDVLKYFQSLPAPSSAKIQNVDIFLWSSFVTIKMNVAVVAHLSNGDAMDSAAANGHLDVVKWLQANRCEGLTAKAMDGAASNGHLHVVKWLHEHTSAGCTSNAMDSAAEHGNLSVLKWLYANRTEGCTDMAVKKSLREGHLAVASWIKRSFPQLKPDNVNLSFREKVSFAVVLFIQEHYSDLFNQEKFWEWFSNEAPTEEYLMSWMHENGLEDCRMLPIP